MHRLAFYFYISVVDIKKTQLIAVHNVCFLNPERKIAGDSHRPRFLFSGTAPRRRVILRVRARFIFYIYAGALSAHPISSRRRRRRARVYIQFCIVRIVIWRAASGSCYLCLSRARHFSLCVYIARKRTSAGEASIQIYVRVCLL